MSLTGSHPKYYCEYFVFEGSLSSSDLVAFLSGLLLGGDTKARNWFSSFVRIGQKVIAAFAVSRVKMSMVLISDWSWFNKKTLESLLPNLLC